MDVWTDNPGPPPESPPTRAGDGDATCSPASDQPENLSVAPAPGATKPGPPSNVTEVSRISLSRAGAVEASTRPRSSVSGEGWRSPSCVRHYLVLARLFKIHPDFEAAIAGVLAGDADGCVVLIHETRDEEWTRVVWARLRGVLVPQGTSGSFLALYHG